jgi:hypothetical protein
MSVDPRQYGSGKITTEIYALGTHKSTLVFIQANTKRHRSGYS